MTQSRARSSSGTATCSAARARTSTRGRSRASGAAPGTTSWSSARSAHPERYDLGGAQVVRPELPAACCPSSCSTTTRGSRRGCSRTLAQSERDALRRGERRGAARAAAGRPRLREPRPARRRRSGARAGAPFARQGARLRARVLDARPTRSSRRGGAEALAARGRGLRRLGAHPRACSRTSSATSSRVHEVPPGVDVEEFAPAAARRGARGAARGGARATRRTRERERAAAGRGQRRAARGVPRRRRADRRLLREADRQQGRPRAARGAARPRRARGDRRLRRLPRRARAAGAAAARSSPGRSSTATSSTCSPLARRRRRAVDLPGGVRDGRGGGRRGGLPAARRAHSGLAEVAAGLEAEYPPELRGLASFATGDARTCASKLRSAARAARRRSAHALGLRRAARPSSAGAGRASPSGCSSPSLDVTFAADGRRADVSATRSSSRVARERSRPATDFTLAVEEEFALLDPETLDAHQPLRGRPGRGARHRARGASRRRADRVRGRGAHGALRDLRRGRRR